MEDTRSLELAKAVGEIVELCADRTQVLWHQVFSFRRHDRSSLQDALDVSSRAEQAS